jgi:hypothetical protein
MKVLTIFRSQPRDRYRQLAAEVAQGHQVQEVHLYARETVDYDQLLADIFANEVIHSWW